MNPEPLNGILELSDGIVAVNGDIVTGVEFLHDKQKLGSSFTRSIRKTVKGTWTDPQSAIEILKKRSSKYPLIVGFGNHELKELAYRGSSISCLKDWIDSLKQINAIPLCTFPDQSQYGATRFYKYGNSYFFSYVTSKIIGRDDKRKRYNHEKTAILEISNVIQKVCDQYTNEIFLLCHAEFNEGFRLSEGIVHNLANSTLMFDLMKVNFTSCFGDNHWGSIERSYRFNGNYWEGMHSINICQQQKKIYFIFPKCADDCIKIDTNNEKSIKTCFITKRI